MGFHMSETEARDRTGRGDSLAYRNDALDSVRDIVLIMRADGRLLDVNSAAIDAYGYLREELLALSIRDLRSEESRTSLASQLDSATHGGVMFETTHRRKDGTAFPVEVSSSRFDADGHPGIISVVRDITARKQNDVLRARLLEQLSETNERLDGALTLLSSTVGAVGLETLLANTVSAVSQVMGTDAALFLVDEGDVMRGRAQSGADKWAPIGSVVRRGEGFCGRVAEVAVPLYVADISASSAILPSHGSVGIRSMFGVPVYVDGALFGVLECAWTEERVVDEAESAMVCLGAERIALAIGQARMYERSVTSERYSATLNEINGLLGASFELDPVLDEVLALATVALGAQAGVFARPSSGTRSVWRSSGTRSHWKTSALRTRSLRRSRFVTLPEGSLSSGGEWRPRSRVSTTWLSTSCGDSRSRSPSR